MENKKSKRKLIIAILPIILIGIVLISGCLWNDGNSQTGSVIPDSDQINRNMPGPEEIANNTNTSGMVSLDDENVYVPKYREYSNITRVGKIGPNNRTYYNYVNKNYNFSIDFPDDWSMLPEDSKIMFLSPKKFEGGYISMVMQILKSSDSGGTYNSVDDVIADLIHEYENNKNVSNLTINYKREEIISGVKGKELSISYRQYGFNYTQPHIIARGGKYFYVIIYVAQTEHYYEDADVYEYTKGHFQMENK